MEYCKWEGVALEQHNMMNFQDAPLLRLQNQHLLHNAKYYHKLHNAH